MLYPFGFPIIPPATPTEEIYKRFGLEQLECTPIDYSGNSGHIDTIFMTLAYISEKQLQNAWGFIFMYNDGTACFNAPCTITYDGSKYYASFSGYNLKPLIDPTKLARCGRIMYFKKGVLK